MEQLTQGACSRALEDSTLDLEHGLPRELVDARNGALGNAIVPQIAEWIGKRIIQAEEAGKVK